MLRYEEFLNSIQGCEEVTKSNKRKGFDVYGEITTRVSFTVFVPEDEIDPDYDFEGQLYKQAYDSFVEAAE